MNDNASIGVFLCRCGEKIDPLVDLETLREDIRTENQVAHCEVLAYPCLGPGLDRIRQAVVDDGLNRLVIAGCEGRLMLKKFENYLAPWNFFKGQIDMINLRGHVAAVSDLSPADKARKAGKLIRASIAEMRVLTPTSQTVKSFDGPVMIAGGGIAAFAAAQQLARRGVDYLLDVTATDLDALIRKVHENYPGEWDYDDRMKKMVYEAMTSDHATVLPPRQLTGLAGVTGDYTLTFEAPEDGLPRSYRSSAIIACIDAQMQAPGPGFGHDGQSVMIQSEMEALIFRQGAPTGKVVFWVSDHESGQSDFAPLSAKSAWRMACHLRESAATADLTILYNRDMEIPLTAAERAVNRRMKIMWVPYDPAVRPTVQSGYITFCDLKDHVEHEMAWDHLVLSPIRAVAGPPLETASVLGLVHKGGRFLTGHHAKVRPEMIGREETYMAGSGRYPCNLEEALNQGRRAGNRTAAMIEKAAAGEIQIPRIVCVVDPDLCVGCGQCQELCDCGGIGVAEGPGGGLPRVVDPMVCTGGGTCAAACPYHALVLQNNTNDQREARVAALASQLAPEEVMAFGCVWGGLPAADNAGKMGLKYDPRLHLLGVPCVGQIDPAVMARALKEGASGLILIGCLPEECHHSYGLDHAWSRVNVVKKLLTLAGIDRRRIALAHADLNKPDEFIVTVESFVRNINSLGPLERTPAAKGRLKTVYDLIKTNTRVRALLSASLRRPWEDAYRGDQRHALEYDRDFSAVLEEEFMNQQLLQLLRAENRPLRLRELASELCKSESRVAEGLLELVSGGMIKLSHKEREAIYRAVN